MKYLMLKILELAQRYVKFNYGYFAAIPKDKEIVLDLENLPYVEGNPEIWYNDFLRDDARNRDLCLRWQL